MAGQNTLDKMFGTHVVVKDINSDSGLGFGGFTTIFKSVDESVTSSTVLQDDDVLKIPVDANTAYIGIMYLLVDAGITGNFKEAFTIPASCTGFKSGPGNWSASVGNIADILTQSRSTTGFVNSEKFIPKQFFIDNGANAGNVTLTWAQNAEDSTATIVRRGSYIMFRKIS